MTGYVPLMWAAWCLFAFAFVAVNLYSAHLVKNEEDQLYLDESSTHIKAEQDVMLARAQRIEPVKRTALVLAGVMTLVVIGYYVFDVMNQFK